MGDIFEEINSGETYRRNAPVLSCRLKTAAGFLRFGRAAADIGCDHGKLAVWLALKNNAPAVIAVDNRPLPLAKAEALVRQSGCGNIVSCRLGSGLEPLAKHEAEDIAIAGVSGETIVDILKNVDWIKNKDINFAFVPSGREQALRKFLYENGFYIKAEQLVFEGGYLYVVINAGYSGKCETPSPLFLEIGTFSTVKNELAEKYFYRKLAVLEKRLNAPLEGQERAQLQQLIAEVKECIQ